MGGRGPQGQKYCSCTLSATQSKSCYDYSAGPTDAKGCPAPGLRSILGERWAGIVDDFFVSSCTSCRCLSEAEAAQDVASAAADAVSPLSQLSQEQIREAWGASATEAFVGLFTCPITYNIMTDPVVCSDGYTYEKSAILQWLHSHDTSPMTNKPLLSTHIAPNFIARGLIQETLDTLTLPKTATATTQSKK